MDEELDDDFDDDHEVKTLYTAALVVPLHKPKKKNDRKGTAIFHTFNKLGDKNCKVIVNSESCINAVSSEVIENDELKVLPHPTRIRYHGSIPQP